MTKASEKRRKQGFYRPNGAAARIKPTTGQVEPKKHKSRRGLSDLSFRLFGVKDDV
jgi:hypothetical protein